METYEIILIVNKLIVYHTERKARNIANWFFLMLLIAYTNLPTDPYFI